MLSRRSPEYDWQLIKASPERDGRECQVGGFDRQPQVGKSGDEVGDRDAGFHPGEVGAQAEVRSFAKRDVVIRVAGDVEVVRSMEYIGGRGWPRPAAGSPVLPAES